MPQDSDGNYIPLTQYQREIAVNYMAILLREGRLTDREIVNHAGSRFGFDNSDFLATYNLLRQAERINDAAVALEINPTHTPDDSELPTRPVDAEHVGEYVYDVLVTITDPNTGISSTFSTRYYSDEPLSASDLDEYFSENRELFRSLVRSPPLTDDQFYDAELTTEILSVGKGR